MFRSCASHDHVHRISKSWINKVNKQDIFKTWDHCHAPEHSSYKRSSLFSAPLTPLPVSQHFSITSRLGRSL